MTTFRFDPLIIKLIIIMLLATFAPASGIVAQALQIITTIAVALLFFFYGAKLSRQKIIVGIKNWRLHLWILCSTYLLFPLIGLLIVFWHPFSLDKQIYAGICYLCVMPATIQSSIAFTSIAGGNIAAAVCSASASSLIGVVISPLLVQVMMNLDSHYPNHTLQQMAKISLHLLLPFALGHLLQSKISVWLEKYRTLINKTDQGCILLIVYCAFSSAVINGIWQRVDLATFIKLIIISLLIFLLVLLVNLIAANFLQFNQSDTITSLFCGSKKSLANGVPMANILFSSAEIGIILLPLMLFHQLQLISCSIIAQYYQAQRKKWVG